MMLSNGGDVICHFNASLIFTYTIHSEALIENSTWKL